MPCRRKWQPTPVFLPGKSHGQRSLECYRAWGRKGSDTTEPSTQPSSCGTWCGSASNQYKCQGLLQQSAWSLWAAPGQPYFFKAPQWVLTRGKAVDAMYHWQGTICAKLLMWLSEILWGLSTFLHVRPHPGVGLLQGTPGFPFWSLPGRTKFSLRMLPDSFLFLSIRPVMISIMKISEHERNKRIKIQDL